MIPYYIMIALPFLMSVVQFESQARQLITKKKNYPILVFFAVYFLLLALRHAQIGSDTVRYLEVYEQITVTGWLDLTNVRESEFAYTLLNKLVSFVFDNKQVFLAVAAAITVIPLAKLYYEESENSMVSIALFLVYPVFMMNFSGIRQGLAISMGALAYFAVKKKKPIRFILVVLLAMSFHQSAFILLLMYPLYHMRMRPVHLPILIPIYALIFLFNDRVYRFVLPLLGDKYADRYDELGETGAYTMIILMVLFFLYAFIVPSKDQMDPVTWGFRNFLVLALVIQLFAPISPIAMRLNYYYIIFIPLLIPRITTRWKSVDPFITKVVNIVMIVFFIGYYILFTTKANSLNIYPYIPFWQ